MTKNFRNYNQKQLSRTKIANKVAHQFNANVENEKLIV